MRFMINAIRGRYILYKVRSFKYTLITIIKSILNTTFHLPLFVTRTFILKVNNFPV